MTATELMGPPAAPRGAEPALDDGPGAILALIGVVPVAGPPLVFMAGPLVLFALLLAGPALLVLTLVAALVACAALVAVAGAIVASPYLLVRSLGRHRLARAHRSAPAARLVPVGALRRTA